MEILKSFNLVFWKIHDPAQRAATLDVPRGIANFRFFADLIKTAHSECFETKTADESPDDESDTAISSRRSVFGGGNKHQ